MAETDRKRPLLAAFLAMVSPGLGHLYLREWLRAVAWFGVILSATSILVPTAAMPATLSAEAVFDAWMQVSETVPVENQVALLAVSTLSMADAYWMANRGNKRAAMVEGTTCPYCGNELDEDLSFCHWCTTELEGQAEQADAGTE